MSEHEAGGATDGVSGDTGGGTDEWSASGNGAAAAPFDEGGGDAFGERPELLVGAAFLGGFALALLLRRRGD